MPNWNHNQLEIKNLTPEESARIVAEFMQEENGRLALDFQKIDPCPEELNDMQSPFRAETEADKEREKELINKYGHSDWYNWRLEHWDCKWNANPDSTSTTVNDTSIYSDFDTPWSPPFGVIKTLSKLFPNADFELIYAEPGMGLSGIATFKNGDIIGDTGPEDKRAMEMMFGEDDYEE